MKIQDTLLADIRTLKSDLEKNSMRLPPGLAGMFGEILAWKEIEKRFKRRGYAIEYYSGQRGADLVLRKDKKLINIEIKTSRLKDEGFGAWYGSALNIKKCRLPDHIDRSFSHARRGKLLGDFCYFDFLVFVKLNYDFGKPKFYVFPRDYIWKHQELLINKHSRFSSSTHRIVLCNDKDLPRLEPVQLKLIAEMEEFRNKWDLIDLGKQSN